MNCIISGNTTGSPYPNPTGATTGGGVSISILYNCTLTGNTSWGAGAAGGGAGGTASNNGSTLTQCTLSDNYSDDIAGGANNSQLTNCAIYGNSAIEGGGVSEGTLVNCLVYDNYALGGDGGGAYYSTTLYNCTVSGNEASYGGGADYCTLYNCIIYYDPYGGDNYYDTLYYCCAPDAGGTGCFTNAPLFVSQSGNNFHLQSQSPCINSGNNAYVRSATDSDGNPRIVGGTVDMGAYEYQTPGSSISYAWLQQYGLPTDGSVDQSDLDGSGFSIYQDWIAGLNPTNPASILAMLPPPATNNTSGVTVSWESVNGINYNLLRSTNLLLQPAFSTIRSNITGQAGTTIYSDTTATNKTPYFYRVSVQ